MNFSRSWRLGANVESPANRFYERLRRRVNMRLVRFLQCTVSRLRAGESTEAHSVLEAGSGTAYASSLFGDCRSVRLAACLDLDLDALRDACTRDPRLRAVVGDLRRMPFRDGAFSLVFNSSTIEHLEQPEQAVCEMRRVSRPDGCVFVGVPYRFGPLGFQPLIRGTSLGRWLGAVFSSSRLQRLLSESGLSPVVPVKYFFRFFIGWLATPSDGSVAECRRSNDP